MPSEEIITSRDNPHIKQLVGLLTRKKEREESGLFVTEGLRLCLEAIDSGLTIPTVLLTPQAGRRYSETVRLTQVAGQVVWISDTLAAKIADTKSPQGVFAVCQKLDNSQTAATIKTDGHYLLLESIQDPGNLGAMLRTAEAMGLDGVHLSGDCPDIYSPKVLRGAMGGVFRLAVTVWPNLADAVALLRQAGLPVYAAALDSAALEAGQVDFSAGGGVLIGNEGNGLTDESIEACTASIVIPMAGAANSLGAAMAAGILMWEMHRCNCGK